MRNNILFNDKRDEKIAKLKYTIQKFKEYDENRKAYYKAKMERLGELESYVLELERNNGIDDLKQKIEQQNKKIKRLNKLIQCYKIDKNQSDSELKDKVSYETLRQNNKSLRKHNKLLKETISRLISEHKKGINYDNNQNNNTPL